MGNTIQTFDGSMALTPLSPAQAIERHEMLLAFVKRSLVQGRDYGVIPGTDKRSLWKPGAEKLCTLFGYSVRLTPTQTEQDWTGAEHGGEPFFFYEHKCEIMHGGVFVTEAYGSCNSFEKKYRMREGKRVCPNCKKETIIKGKQEYGGGWVCFAKKGGCGAKFTDNDPAVANQKVGMVKNDEIFDQVNTILKMSQKRAMVGATVIACNASEFFSSEFDSEGYDEDALDTTPLVVIESTAVIEAKAKAASRQLYGEETDLVNDAAKQTDRGPAWTGQEQSSAQAHPDEPQAQQATEPVKTNGKPKSAALKYQPFVSWCNEWVNLEPNAAKLAKQDGLAHMYNILCEVGQLGYQEVTEENQDAVKASLRKSVEAA